MPDTPHDLIANFAARPFNNIGDLSASAVVSQLFYGLAILLRANKTAQLGVENPIFVLNLFVLSRSWAVFGVDSAIAVASKLW